VLAKHNNRDWFNSNKNRYQTSVVEPVCDFIEAFAPRLENISTEFIADSRPHGGSMFRIYRDTRFSRDKRPYKENVGCQFRHMAGKDAHAPGFYVHLSPQEVFFGAGLWKPPTATLNHIRTKIVEHPDRWRAIIENRKLQDYFGDLCGERLQRPPRDFPDNHEYAEDLKLKSFILMRHVEPVLVTTAEFIDEVENTFNAASPMMQFLTTAVGLKY
jgi:uncharacterized protein (TIGR02453 family)